jgi:sugar lactone lactonase YvrE
VVFATYFNAGVRVYDLSDAERPREIASWVATAPAGHEAAQINDLFVARDGLIYVTDRVAGGMDVLEPDTELLERMDAAALD